MKVIGRKHLKNFQANHAGLRSHLAAWLAEVEDAQWQSPQDVKERFPHASILADNGLIFNLKGKKYRLETKVNYEYQTVLIKRIGTHAEYSKWKC